MATSIAIADNSRAAVLLSAMLLSPYATAGSQLTAVGWTMKPAEAQVQEPAVDFVEMDFVCAFPSFNEQAWSAHAPDVLSTLGAEAAAALQADGLARLVRFDSLAAGWDSLHAEALDQQSVAAMSEFFRRTELAPPDLALFMSQRGFLVTSWHHNGSLVELEFARDRVEYFFDLTGDEGSVSIDDAAPFIQTVLR